MSDPEIGHLRALAAVVDEGSFEQAAVALHVTASAISQRIKALETTAGRVLVQRTKPTAITDAGRRYLRLARQIGILLDDAGEHEQLAEDDRLVTVPIAVNGDSLTTWALAAIAELSDRVCFDIHREDQDHSAALLRAGTVMGAITTDAEPIQGCSVSRLGTMRYRAMASPPFVARWFSSGMTAATMARAPIVVFDRKDDLQDRFLRSRFRGPMSPPRHHIPGATDFADAIRLGFGWGMIPDLQSSAAEALGEIVDIAPGHHVDVTLYWQQWTLETPMLSAIAAAIGAAAARSLT
jgi:LysR family transcriptional regulator (chromosome initiation inhibitor)